MIVFQSGATHSRTPDTYVTLIIKVALTMQFHSSRVKLVLFVLKHLTNNTSKTDEYQIE